MGLEGLEGPKGAIMRNARRLTNAHPGARVVAGSWGDGRLFSDDGLIDRWRRLSTAWSGMAQWSTISPPSSGLGGTTRSRSWSSPLQYSDRSWPRWERRR